MKTKNFLFFILVTGLVFGSRFILFRNDDPILLRVGRFTVSQKELELCQSVEKFLYPQAKKFRPILSLLKDDFIKAEVLLSQGVLMSHEILQKEAERIDRESAFPSKIAEIKRIFETEEAYLKLFVLPSYARSKIYPLVFENNSKIHQKSFSIALEFMKKISSKPKDFEELARLEGFEILKFRLNASGDLRIVDDSVDPIRFEDQTNAKQPKNLALESIPVGRQKNLQWETEIPSKTKVGQIYPRVINASSRWQIIKYLGLSERGEKNFLVAQVPKVDFREWLKKEAENIEVVMAP